MLPGDHPVNVSLCTDALSTIIYLLYNCSYNKLTYTHEHLKTIAFHFSKDKCPVCAFEIPVHIDHFSPLFCHLALKLLAKHAAIKLNYCLCLLVVLKCRRNNFGSPTVSLVLIQWKQLIMITDTVINHLDGSKSLRQNHSYTNV